MSNKKEYIENIKEKTTSIKDEKLRDSINKDIAEKKKKDIIK